MNIIRRIQRLLRLAQSPNKHEAKSARETAYTLLLENGLTLDDIEEDTFHIVKDDGPARLVREDLAVAIARARGCSLFLRPDGQLGFMLKGRPRCVQAALNLYGALAQAGDDEAARSFEEATQRAPIPIAPGTARIWQINFWFGYGPAVSKRVLLSSGIVGPARADGTNGAPDSRAGISFSEQVVEADSPAKDRFAEAIQEANAEMQKVAEEDFGGLDGVADALFFRIKQIAMAAGAAFGQRAPIEPSPSNLPRPRPQITGLVKGLLPATSS